MASLTVRYGLFQSVVALYICGTKEHITYPLYFPFIPIKKTPFYVKYYLKIKVKAAMFFESFFFFVITSLQQAKIFNSQI